MPRGVVCRRESELVVSLAARGADRIWSDGGADENTVQARRCASGRMDPKNRVPRKHWVDISRADASICFLARGMFEMRELSICRPCRPLINNEFFASLSSLLPDTVPFKSSLCHLIPLHPIISTMFGLKLTSVAVLLSLVVASFASPVVRPYPSLSLTSHVRLTSFEHQPQAPDYRRDPPVWRRGEGEILNARDHDW